MSISEIKQLPLHEKLPIMEALWDDLRSHTDAVLVPDWQKDLLNARRRAVEKGTEQILEWDDIKDSLGATAE
ncbi:MAG: addiction module protein [Verrucomicrobiia bacterium]|jgi:putative addiction module component (TIGR02574 family)